MTDGKSKVEQIKEASRGLRGTIAHELARDTDRFGEADSAVLKHHGVYQQDDRDARKRSEDHIYQLMVRCKIPGGLLTRDQYLALDDIATRYANDTLRITTRQDIQFHGV